MFIPQVGRVAVEDQWSYEPPLSRTGRLEAEVSLAKKISTDPHPRSREAVVRNEDDALPLKGVLQAAPRLERNGHVVLFNAQDGSLPDARQRGQLSLTDIKGDARRAQ